MMLDKNSSLFPDDDVRPERHSIPIDFFECMNDDSKFLDMLQSLLHGEFYWHSSGVCEFPNAEEKDGDFQGVRFTNWLDQVSIISVEEMETLLLEASQRYALINPSKGEEIKRMYNRYGKNFELPELKKNSGWLSFIKKALGFLEHISRNT